MARLLRRGARWLADVRSVELLVLTGVVLVALALLLPWLQWSRDAARGTQTRDSLRRLGTAMGSYHDTFQRFPQVGRGVRVETGRTREASAAPVGNLPAGGQQGLATGGMQTATGAAAAGPAERSRSSGEGSR